MNIPGTRVGPDSIDLDFKGAIAILAKGEIWSVRFLIFSLKSILDGFQVQDCFPEVHTLL